MTAEASAVPGAAAVPQGGLELDVSPEAAAAGAPLAQQRQSFFGHLSPGVFGHSLFGGRDPFCEFSPEPFRLGGIHSAISRSFNRVLATMERMEESIEELVGLRHHPEALTTELLEAERQQREEQPMGAYSIQTATMRTFLGLDGRLHTEQFASSDVGHRDHDIRETHQAYSNSATRIQRRALEQQLEGRGRKTVREVGRDGKELTKEMYLGMEEKDRAAFDEAFQKKAVHLPAHRLFEAGQLAGFGASCPPALQGAAAWSALTAPRSSADDAAKAALYREDSLLDRQDLNPCLRAAAEGAEIRRSLLREAEAV